MKTIILKYISFFYFASFLLFYGAFIYAQGTLPGYEGGQKNFLFHRFAQNNPTVDHGENKCMTQPTLNQPMFVISGPTMSYDMLPYDETTAKKLIFQGEIMISIGKVMVEEGESLKKDLQTKVNPLVNVEKTIDTKFGPQLLEKLNSNILQDEKVELAILTSNDASKIEPVLKSYNFSTSLVDGKMVIGSVSLSNVKLIAENPEIKYLEINSQKKKSENTRN